MGQTCCSPSQAGGRDQTEDGITQVDLTVERAQHQADNREIPLAPPASPSQASQGPTGRNKSRGSTHFESDVAAAGGTNGDSPRSPTSGDLPLANVNSVASLASLNSQGVADDLRKGRRNNLSAAAAAAAAAARNRRLTRVAAGHGGMSILKDFDDSSDNNDVPSYVIKVYDKLEVSCYERLQDTDDPLCQFTPRFCGVVEAEDLAHLEAEFAKEGTKAERYMRLSNLMKGFKRGPHVMDCKLGVRSFGESEVANDKMREDLYKKLVALDPSAPTAEEKAAGACTKYRWMSFNDQASTLKQYGFRIDGIAHSGPEGKTPKKELQEIKTLDMAAACIVKDFLPRSVGPPSVTEAHEDDDPALHTEEVRLARLQYEVADTMLELLRKMKLTMESSKFVQGHSFVGTSLLFIVDTQGPNVGVWLIDFAKTSPVPDGVEVSHLREWQKGNHEDGLLIGMDNMIYTWEQVVARVEQKSQEVVDKARNQG
mmetsp:Transcript_52418/g.125229  ORF Transcript_52418/g.125229 Transcript_52418/m.125229 type:complete len:484 (-) Transcript_52418:143-1594(-)